MESSSFPAQLSFITDLFSNTRLRQDFASTIVDKLQVWTSCQCVGIRMVNSEAYIPYEAYVGFSQEFWEHENWLSLREHQCCCIRVVNDETHPVDQPILTEKGSILSNDLQAFGESLCPADATLYRGKCIDYGFGSLAVVPIRKQDTVIGLIHLADKRTNLLPSVLIQTLEALTAPIAEVIERFNTENVLVENSKMLSQAQKIAHIGSWKLNLATNRLACSDEVYRIFGCEPQEFDATYEDFLGFIHPDDRAAVDKAYSSSVREGRDSYEIEHRIVRRISDEIRYVHERCFHERDASGAIVQSIGMVQDITERKWAEETLREQHDFSESLIETAQAIILVLDTQGRIVRFNPYMEQLVGYRLDEVKGLDWFETFIKLENKNTTKSVFIKTVDNIQTSGTVNSIITKDGRTVLVEWSNKTLKDKAGRTVGVLAVGQDITERIRAEETLRESLELLNTTQRLSKTGGWEWSTVTQTMFWDEETYRIHGYMPGEIEPGSAEHINRSLACYGPEARAIILGAFQRCVEQGEPYDLTLPFTNAKGSQLWVRTTAHSVLESGKIVRVIGNIVDITKRKQAEEALQQKNREMEQLIYIVSHDLKSPLVTVKTFVNILRQDLQGDQPQINEDLNYIDKAADKMQQLLDALLQYSRIGRIDTLAQTVSAELQVHNCLATLAGILQQQHQVQVSTGDLPHQLHGDPLHFGQIWQNLIENAVKYRGDQPQLHIEIGATQEVHDVVFYVRDNGMGIEPEHNERIFNLFSQLQPGSDGSGLGLALVKKIVTIYQGRIWVESDGVGQGSCFMFTLPGALVKEDTAI